MTSPASASSRSSRRKEEKKKENKSFLFLIFFPRKKSLFSSSDCHKLVKAIGASHINSRFNYIFPFQLAVCSFNSFNCLVARKESWECQNMTCSITTVSVITRAWESSFSDSARTLQLCVRCDVQHFRGKLKYVSMTRTASDQKSILFLRKH